MLKGYENKAMELRFDKQERYIHSVWVRHPHTGQLVECDLMTKRGRKLKATIDSMYSSQGTRP